MNLHPAGIFLCLAISLQQLHAQTPAHYEHFTTENGLSSNIIYSLAQDAKGFLWIGTHVGLSRFDGYKFKVFRNDPNDKSSIPANRVHALATDSLGYTWIGTVAGLCRYNDSTGNFTTVQLTRDPQSVWQIIPTNKNEIMVTTGPEYSNRDFWVINIHSLQQTPVTYNRENGALGSRACVDPEGNIIIAFITKPGFLELHKYDPERKKFFVYRLIKTNEKLTSVNAGYSLFVDGRNRIWLDQSPSDIDTRLLAINPVSEKQTRLVVEKKKAGSVRSIAEGPGGSIWVCTTTGIYQVTANNESGQLEKIYTETVSKPIIQSSTLIDRNGILWLGGFDGLFKLGSSSKRFRNLELDKNRSLSILGLYQDVPGKLRIHYLFGTDYYSTYDISTGAIQHHPRNVSSLVKFWLRNPQSLQDSTYKILLNKWSDYAITLFTGDAMVDHSQQVWGQRDGKFILANTGTPMYSDILVLDFQLGGDSIWLATYTGLHLFDKTRQKHIRTYLFNATDSRNITSNALNSVIKGNDNLIWVGTSDAGFCSLDPKTGKIERYTQKDGLCSNNIYSMVMDDEGCMWMGTGNGLSCFDPSSKKFRNYSRADGLINIEYNRNSAIKLGNGMIYMGGMDGIDYFDPQQLKSSVKNLPLVITDVRIFDKSVNPYQKLSLTHNQNFVSIYFAVMDFTKPSLNNFLYKLEGIDEDWVNAETRNYAGYANLSPGHYKFMVKGSNSNGEWNTEPVIFEFYIRTPWWRTALFYIICAVSILSLLIIFYKYRIQQLKKMILLRSKISRDLHDEVGATLTSISFLSEVAKKQNGKGAGSDHTIIDQIGEFSRDMIGEMNDIVWAINPSNDKLDKLEDRMQNFASTHLAAKNIHLNFRAEEQIRQVSLGMQQRKNLYLIFKEAVNNAAKYAECSEVCVHIFKEDHTLRLEISDNGKGFLIEGKPGPFGGNGLKNMRQRAEEVNARITIDSEPGNGTRIILSMPITQNAY